MLWEMIKNIKIKYKILMVLAVALTAVFLGTLCSSFLPYRAYDDQLYKSGVQTLSLFSDGLEAELNHYVDLSYRLLGDDVIQDNLTQMRKSDIRSEEWRLASNALTDHLVSYANTIGHAVCFRVKTFQGMNYAHSWGVSTLTVNRLKSLEQVARAAGGSAVWVTLPGPASRIILVRDIREVEGLTFKSLATIYIELDLKELVESKIRVMEEMGCPLAVAVYEDQNCLYASNEQVQGVDLNADGYTILDTEEGPVLCTRYTSSQGWHFITIRQFSQIRMDIGRALRATLTLSVLAVIITLALGSLLINIILRHLQVLLRKIDNFRQGKMPESREISLYRERKDEMGRLHRHFDRMIGDYDRVVRDNYEKQLAIKEAQARHLRAQIRPHFLYNTLQTIYVMAREAGHDRIAEMTGSLGKLMHATINEQADIITVREDWQIAREYLRIQQMRYQDHLDIRYELDSVLEKNHIPSITIQPLVENAIHYAAEEMMDTCCIRIWGQQNSESVDICVEDNGPGMDEDILQKLETGEVQPDGIGIGLTNIHRRIQLEFSAEFGLRICCRDGKTQVFIHLPKNKENELP